MADYILNVTINGAEQSVQTIGQLEQALKATNDELAKTDANTDAFAKLDSQVKVLEGELVSVTQDASKFNNQLKGINSTSDMLSSSLQDTATQAQQLGKNANMQNLNQGINQATNSTQSLKAELRQTIQELQKLEPGSARFQELSVRAGELKDQIADTNNVVGVLAGNTTERLGTALSGVVNIGVTGLQAVVGGMQLFGVESERSKEILEKLQGLLFVTQAIQGFGALPDSIAAIKAGLQSLTVARTVDVAAQQAQAASTTAETASTVVNTAANAANTAGTRAHATAMVVDTVATEGATIATRGFTAALAANPIGLIVVGLTALISSLFLFGGEAEKSTEETDRFSESLQKLDDETNQYIQSLREEARVKIEIARLRGDEQLAAKLAIEALEEEREAKNRQQTKIIEDLTSYLDEQEGLLRDYLTEEEDIRFKSSVVVGDNTLVNNQVQTELMREFYEKRKADDEKAYQERRESLLNNTKAVVAILKTQLAADPENKALKALLDNYQKTSNAITKINGDITIADEREKARQREIAKRNAEKLAADRLKATDDYEQSLEDIRDAQEQNNFDLRKLQIEQGKIIVKDGEVQLGIKEAILFEEFLAEKKKIEDVLLEKTKEIESNKALTKKKRDAQVASLKAETDTEIQTLKELNDNKRATAKIQDSEDIANANIKSAELKLINDILNKEIAFGDQNTSDLLINLTEQENIKLQQLAIERLDFENSQQNLGIESYAAYLQNRFEKQQVILEKQETAEISTAENERTAKIKNFVEYLNKSELLQSQSDQERIKTILEAETELQLEQLKKDKEALELKGDLLNDEERAELALIQTKLNAEQELVAKKTEINENYLLQNEKSENEVTDSILKYRLKKFEEFFGQLESSLSVFQDSQVAGFSSVVTSITTGIQDYFKILDQDFGTLTEKIAAYATLIGSLVNSILAGFVSQNKAMMDAELSDTQATYDALKDTYTEDYNYQLSLIEQKAEQGLLTEQQYTDALENLKDGYDKKISDGDKKLAADQYAIKKKAFEDDKKLKIAQAVISGLQGAVQAFAGAMSLPFPASIIVGAILAAAVGGLAAANVAQIKNTKFDGGQSVSQNSPTVDSTGLGSGVADSSLPQGGGFTTFSEGAMGTPGGFVPSTPFSGSSNQRVYVVESDITAAQNRVRVLEENSTFG
jgi:hypothetical protein